MELGGKGFGGSWEFGAFCYFSVITACVRCVLLWYNPDISYKSSNYLGSTNQSDLTLYFPAVFLLDAALCLDNCR